MSEDKDPQKMRQAAKKKVMDLLARRNHSEKELRQKLQEKITPRRTSRRDRSLDSSDTPPAVPAADIIEDAINFAKDNNWLGDPAALAVQMADALHRRKKGIHYINNYLHEKGLPAVDVDRDLELEKALAIVNNKYDENYKFTREEKAKVGRLLASRGFDSETVRKVIYEKL